MFRELFDRFSIDCLGCIVVPRSKDGLAQKRTWRNLPSLINKSDERLHTTAPLTSLWSLITPSVDLQLIDSRSIATCAVAQAYDTT